MDNQNSVAFIGRIKSLSAITGADKIVLAEINGWTSVVQKGIHNVGDLILCITTDAVIPEDLATKWGVINYLRKGSRVRTIRLKGVYSECILIPLIDIPSYGIKSEGMDMMSYLNIIKYESPVRTIETPKTKRVYFKFTEIHKPKMWKSYFNYLYNVTKNKFKKYYKDNINFEIYYKFPNQKNTPNMFNEQDVVQITRKIHGANFRCGIVKKNYLSPSDKIKKLFGNKWIDYEFVYGSHRVEKGSDSQGYYSTDIWKEMVDKYNLKIRLWDLVENTQSGLSIGKGVILYGEVFGEGVQGKEYSYGLNDRELVFFDMEIDGIYQSVDIFKGIMYHDLGLPIVEELYSGNWSKEIQSKLVGGFIPNTKTPHEGIVVKHISGDRKKVSKVINPDYLIFGEKNNIEDLEAH